MTKFLFLVFTKPVPGRDDEFNRWYTEQHLNDVLKCKGFTAAQRFSLAPAMGGAADALPPYLAIYEIEGEGTQEALADLVSKANTAAMPISEAMDATAGLQFMATPISERVTA
jgi:hypothetical protein